MSKMQARGCLEVFQFLAKGIGEASFLGKDISVRIVASAPITKFTQKTIDK
jgi:hypothetical protein